MGRGFAHGVDRDPSKGSESLFPEDQTRGRGGRLASTTLASNGYPWEKGQDEGHE
jgi:hypothetical protein